MQLGWEDHFHGIVMAAWRAYQQAETALSKAAAEDGDVELARLDALREGGAAALYLHHFTDIVANERPPSLPDEVSGVQGVRDWVAEACVWLRGKTPVEDVELLGDIADALKHAALTRRLDKREVAANDAVVVVGRGYGQLSFGEGKYGGGDQVIILAKTRERALTSILRNVIDAWHRKMGWELPE